MSDFGLFESDEAAQHQPRLAARTAAMKLQAAVDKVQSEYGRFLLGATGIDEFEDRWHLSKADIRKTIEPYVFPNTGTMRRVHNAMKQEWKIAHPYKVALSHEEAGFGSMPEDDGPPKNLHLDKTYHSSDGNLVPKGDFEGWKDSVDQDGPEKVESHAFTPGGDSGRHARRVRTGGMWDSDLYDEDGEYIGPPWPQDLAHHLKGDPSRAAYDAGYEASWHPDFMERDDPWGDASEAWYNAGGKGEGFGDGWVDAASDIPHKFNDPEGHAQYWDEQEGSRRVPRESSRREAVVPSPDPNRRKGWDWDKGHRPSEDSTEFGDVPYDGVTNKTPDPMRRMLQQERDRRNESREAARLVADIYTDFARSNGLRVASLDTLDLYASTGIHEADYRLLQSMIIRQAESEECDEDCDDDEDDDSEAPSASEGDESDSGDDSDEDYDFGGEEAAEDDEEDSEDDDFGGDDEGGGEQYTVPDHAPELPPEMMQEIPQDDPSGSAPVPPEVIDSLLGLPEGTIEQLLLEEVEQGGAGDPGISGAPMPPEGDSGMGAPQGGGDDFFGGDGDDAEQEQPPRTAHRRRRANMARRFWAAEGDQEQESEGGGEQAAPAQDPAAGGAPMDPAAMGMGQPMMPPPGSGAVAPPAPPQPMEDQPAEDALLDTANQAIMQMIDRETQEYQQIIDPLSQALQAIQFAQQVEQAEHPMDVTPPQGTVDVSPSAAPGGQPPMQQQARRRRAAAPDRKGPWTDIVYAQGDDYNEMADMGPEEMFHHMKQWDYGDDDNVRDEAPWGTNDRLHSFMDGDLEYVVSHGDGGAGLVRRPINRQSRRQAKVETALRNAAKLIASRYRLSATGHQMLLEATLGRRGYEHVVEALKLVPPEVRKAAAIHMSHLFAAGNQRFNRDVFMKTVMAGTARERYRDKAYSGPRDKRRDEHGDDDLQRGLDDWGDDMGDLFGGGNSSKFPNRKSSRGRLPFELPRRTAGETWTNTPTKDAFEFPNAGETPRVDDNIDINDLPLMQGADPHGKNAASQKAVDRFQRWQERQRQRGLPTTQGESAVHNFLQTSKPYKKRVGPDAANMIHRELGLEPDAVKTPKTKPVKAVNPTLKGKGGKTPAAPKAKAPAPKAAPKTASFFTRKVPGWRWDDHLNGYISKEGKAFTCNCGQKVAAPSYKSCDCGKIWNVYAIGDTHHLASDSAEMFIAREIPVRDNVIMANKKLAGHEDDERLDRLHDDVSEYVRLGFDHNDLYYHDLARRMIRENYLPPHNWMDETGNFLQPVPVRDMVNEWRPRDLDHPDFEGHDWGKQAAHSHRELLAEIERLADWTKYDSPDPSRDPKAKPPSTTIPKQPKDWTNREFTGPDKGQWRDPDPTELPRKTRKKK